MVQKVIDFSFDGTFVLFDVDPHLFPHRKDKNQYACRFRKLHGLNSNERPKDVSVFWQLTTMPTRMLLGR